MQNQSFIYFIFLVFTGAAVLSTVALYTRQSLLVAYMILGVLFGPSGLKLVPDLPLAHQIGDVGVIFLLFLIGLELSPIELLNSLRKTTLITIVSSLLFVGLGVLVGYVFGFKWLDNLLIGSALMFSSTIIGLKLLPSTMLRKHPVGEWMISILLLQDFFAIAMLILVHGANMTGSRLIDISLALITLPALLGFAFFIQHYLIANLLARFNKIKEYQFLLALGWCLGMAQLAYVLGLTADVGAFLAGISMAEGSSAVLIAQRLKPLRDFCLVMFFFAVGASLDLSYLPDIWAAALLLTGLIILVKPWVFSWLLCRAGEKKEIATEIGFRLGQGSEFSLLIAYFATETALLSDSAYALIQATTLFTFIVSSYWVVLRYPTPLAMVERLRRG